MEVLLEWIKHYSLPVVVLLCLGTVWVFVLSKTVEQAISAEFDQRTKQVNVRLEKRSNFEEQVLLDRYKVVRDVERRIQKVATDLNRVRHGSKVKGRMNGSAIVPLTEVFEELNSNRFLLTKPLYHILSRQAQLVLNMEQERDLERSRELETEYVKSHDEFIAAMNREFEINKISYSMETR
ncbi:MAG: hypothetical protein H0X47_04555 [Nitrospirales bacterium]|nr:hypothetical protein [Nitrospirales bacterium]